MFPKLGQVISPPHPLSSRPFRFYRAMLCIRGTSHEPVSVRVCHKPVFY